MPASGTSGPPAGVSRAVAFYRGLLRAHTDGASTSHLRPKALVELLIDRVIVSDGEVEVRYVMPTCKNSEQIRFRHLQLDYRAGPSERKASNVARQRLRFASHSVAHVARNRGNGDAEKRQSKVGGKGLTRSAS